MQWRSEEELLAQLNDIDAVQREVIVDDVIFDTRNEENVIVHPLQVWQFTYVYVCPNKELLVKRGRRKGCVTMICKHSVMQSGFNLQRVPSGFQFQANSEILESKLDRVAL